MAEPDEQWQAYCRDLEEAAREDEVLASEFCDDLEEIVRLGYRALASAPPGGGPARNRRLTKIRRTLEQMDEILQKAKAARG